MNGIAFPIGFLYNYRGTRYSEIELYFSFQAIRIEDIDLLEPGRSFARETRHLIKRGLQGDFDFLIPQEPHDIVKYEAPWNMRFSIGTIDKNPTTATMLNRIALYPCKENNLNTTLKLLGSPPFYFSQTDGTFFLHIRSRNDRFVKVPSQHYCPRCWQGFAHPAITMAAQNGSRAPH